VSKVQRSRPGAESGLARPHLQPTVEAPVIDQRPPANSQSLSVPDPVTPRLPDPVTPGAPQPVTLDVASQPKYLQLLRKEARIRVDQAADLASLRRQLMRRRVNRGAEVITDNTLIRVAVDLLLTRAGELRGDTEDELRASLDLPEVPKSASL
jgi:hypothetical protein